MSNPDTEVKVLKQETLTLPRLKCRSCGCLWRDNMDGSVSLFDGNQKSCDKCEHRTDESTCDIDWFTVFAANASVERSACVQEVYRRASNPDTPTLETAMATLRLRAEAYRAEREKLRTQAARFSNEGEPTLSEMFAKMAEQLRMSAVHTEVVLAAAARVQALEQETCETCRFAGEPTDKDTRFKISRMCAYLAEYVPLTVNGRPFRCPGWQAKDAASAHDAPEMGATT